MADVHLKQVVKNYGDTRVIHGIDMDIADGEFVVLVGPSGCGKSTTLRMVAGLEEITGGDISIANRVVNQLEPKDRDIAMVFQNYALYPHMSVYDNMAYGLKIKGLPKDEIEKRVKMAADLLQLSALLERRPRQLSGGQRQRVAMGRAIVREPAVFLFDEPLSNLDAKLRVQMRVEIKRLQRRLGTTSIYVTHDQVEAMTMADRLVVMHNGVAEQIGTPLEVYERPATIFVAGFIGSPSMNFLPATLTADGKHVDLGGGMVLPVPTAPAGAANRAVTLGVRPEHLTEKAEKSAATIAITVDLVEMLGADTLVYGHIEGTESSLTARLPGISPVKIGALLHLAPPLDELHLFDPETSKRLN
ncbi:sn-glycerol-3-phosphate import ATP-binding protein UgpC [Oceanibaculum pacificum]|uniref:Glycerol-3-phosphate ABC transporter ATP-binding protein n=1 Tax=Oceanibaculum pacificum TaxID=580166 RepID=A0A154WH12_9PROT|nr:sn-glycerol-3-phosphate import ATP-binding protein UgpC [Oceanibaculum pacificum]KZD12800.1 glycerol-3-phosphate ABC transporter ATP-binding protein [Oceanibaculum pacificum]